MRLLDDVNLEWVVKDTHRYVGADLAPLSTEAVLQCIKEKMDLIDLEDESIDVEILNSMAVTNQHFTTALGTSNPSALRWTGAKLAQLLQEAALVVVRRGCGSTSILQSDIDDVVDRLTMGPKRVGIELGHQGQCHRATTEVGTAMTSYLLKALDLYYWLDSIPQSLISLRCCFWIRCHYRGYSQVQVAGRCESAAFDMG
ncbi:hypothetical protein IFM89_014658 [Coptis chinensis]|uniref:AAA ATPase AAA+ lid domain-containing protein n=1 Tax=Coptis chinensis TaxID=261450 RepID=A0A835LQB5_9MAGN|nr:hypothetical protein IFM89_014658 [Coptis chinensis]